MPFAMIESGVDGSPDASDQGLAGRDAALMIRVVDGDHGLPLQDLIDRYAGVLFGAGLRLTGDPADAEELVHTTFLRLVERAQEYDPGSGSVRSFVCGVARHAAADMARLRIFRTPPRPADREGPFDDGLVGLDVRDAVASLPHRHREIVELLCDEHMGRGQIAGRLGIPAEVVNTRVLEALGALRGEFGARGLVY